MTLVFSGLRIASVLLFAIALAGCASEDRRLTDDEESCRGMGHLPGSVDFKPCMEDLNARRCATMNFKGGSKHSATVDCTRL